MLRNVCPVEYRNTIIDLYCQGSVMRSNFLVLVESASLGLVLIDVGVENQSNDPAGAHQYELQTRGIERISHALKKYFRYFCNKAFPPPQLLE